MKRLPTFSRTVPGILLSLLALSPASARPLINEVHINPPGLDDSAYQYIEIITVDDDNRPVEERLGDVQLILVDASGGNIGEIQVTLSLNGLYTGTNGLLLIGLGYDDPRGGVWAGVADPGTEFADLEYLESLGNFGKSLRDPIDIGPKSGLALFLVEDLQGGSRANPNEDGVVDLDDDDNGNIRSRPPWGNLLDSVSYNDRADMFSTDLGLLTAFNVPPMPNEPSMPWMPWIPDNISRRAGTGTISDPEAWYGGTIDGNALSDVDYNSTAGEVFGPYPTGQATPGKPNIAAPGTQQFLINEVVISHPTNDFHGDGTLEYVELLNTAGSFQHATGLSLLVLATDRDSNRGEVLEVWNLDSFASGANGLLLLGDAFPDYFPWGEVPAATALADPEGMGTDEFRSSRGFSLLLVRDLDQSVVARQPGASDDDPDIPGTDLDIDDDDKLDSTPPLDILDSLGASQLHARQDAIDPLGRTYAEVDLAQPAPGGGYMPDAFCRKRGDHRPNTKDSWYGGTLGGLNGSPTNITFSYQSASGEGFFGGFQGALTPGARNLNEANPNPDIQEDARILLSEIHIDPPGAPDGNYEFLELISTNGSQFSTRDLQILFLDSAANSQEIRDLWRLDGLSTGPNGILLLGDNYGDETDQIHPDLRFRLVSHREDPKDREVDDVDVAPNESATTLLVRGFTGSVGNQLDTDGDGAFDSTPWTQLLDSVSIGPGPRDPSIAHIEAPFLPHTLSRIPNDHTPNSPAAWTGGTLAGTEQNSIVYERFFGPYRSEASPGAWNLAAGRSASANLLLNEIHVNPPGDDGSYEFVEILSTNLEAASTNDLTLVLLDTSGTNTGRIIENWSLDGFATGSNGLLLLGPGYTSHDAIPWGSVVEPATGLGDPSWFSSGDLGPNDNLNLLLVREYPGHTGLDLDDGTLEDDTEEDPTMDDGIIDEPLPWTPAPSSNDPTTGSLDSAGYRRWSEPAEPGMEPGWDTKTYVAADLSQPGYHPGSVSRIAANFVSNSSAAWYGGVIASGVTSNSASIEFGSQRFPANDLLDATVTPGYHNFGGELLVPTEDEDGDGANNGSEALAGTDPRDPADYFRVVSTSNSGTEIVLEWSSLEGKSYNIEYSTTQEPGSWIVINPAPIPGSAEGKSSFQDTDPGRLAEPEGYYRAVVFP